MINTQYLIHHKLIMYDLNQYINILRSGIVHKTDIPDRFLYTPEIQQIIYYDRWVVIPCNVQGWVTLIKTPTYHN